MFAGQPGSDSDRFARLPLALAGQVLVSKTEAQDRSDRARNSDLSLFRGHICGGRCDLGLRLPEEMRTGET